MKLADKIKFECFCAFIHSRLTNAGTYDEGVEVFNEEVIIKKIDSIGRNIISEIQKVGTIKSINNKIEKSQSGLIANMYHKNYTKLLDVLDKNIKKNEECVMPLIGLGMLMAYFEKDKNENLLPNISLKELNEVYSFFDSYLLDTKLKIKMMKTATTITEKYL